VQSSFQLFLEFFVVHLRESFENEVGEKYKEFSRCKPFFKNLNRSKMR
jgi:hypothetical protein